MAWTDEEYEVANLRYCAALEREERGRAVSWAELATDCGRLIGRKKVETVRKHLSKLHTARSELGLPVLRGPGKDTAERSERAIEFLRAKYALADRIQPCVGSAASVSVSGEG